MKTFRTILLIVVLFGISSFKTADACSFQFDGPRPELTMSEKLKSLFIETGVGGPDCSAYTTISPFLMMGIIALISSLILVKLIKKLKTGTKNIYFKIIGYIISIPLVIICAWSILISIGTLLQIFLN